MFTAVQEQPCGPTRPALTALAGRRRRTRLRDAVAGFKSEIISEGYTILGKTHEKCPLPNASFREAGMFSRPAKLRNGCCRYADLRSHQCDDQTRSGIRDCTPGEGVRSPIRGACKQRGYRCTG